MDATATGAKRGRPRKPRSDGSASGPRAGKGAALTTTISVQMRDELDAEAARTGRSISQVAEVWMEQGRHLAALGSAGPDVEREISHMLRFAAAVAQHEGDPMCSVSARGMMRDGWTFIARRALDNARNDAVRHANATRIMAHKALSGLPTRLLNDPRLPELNEILSGLVRGTVEFDTPSWDDARARLAAFVPIVWDEFFGERADWREGEDEMGALYLYNVPRLMSRVDQLLTEIDELAHGAIERTVLLLLSAGVINQSQTETTFAALMAQGGFELAEARKLLGEEGR